MRIEIVTDNSARSLPEPGVRMSWEGLQALIRAMRDVEDVYEDETGFDNASMVRISRKDKGCDYSATGEYEVELRDGTKMRVTFDAMAQGRV